MIPELSYAAARIIRFVEFDKLESFTVSVENAKSLNDIPQPYRNWMQGIDLPGKLDARLMKGLIKS